MIEILFIASIILTIICIFNLYKQFDLNDFAESYFWLILTDISALSIIDRGYNKTEVRDFLSVCKDDVRMSPDIITNPPYALAKEFVEHALDISMDSVKVAMFLKIQFLESKKRYELFKKYPPKKIYVFVNRVNCGKNGVFGKESSAVCYAWFVWEKGYKGLPQVDWIG